MIYQETERLILRPLTELDYDALKAGFQFESVRKRFVLEDGIWTDNEIYYINRVETRER